MPACQCAHKKVIKLLTFKPIEPTEDEIRENPRSRSAKMRVAERIK
jgi:16S rRNA (cytosine1402-N4)-methyltransferase